MRDIHRGDDVKPGMQHVGDVLPPLPGLMSWESPLRSRRRSTRPSRPSARGPDTTKLAGIAGPG
jgi:hypothetical protein